MSESNTNIGPNSEATACAAPDADTLVNLQGQVVARPTTAMDGTYQPAEGKLYTEYMKISYGVGFGAELGVAPGSLVLGKKDVIAGPKTPLTCIIVGARGFWREWKAYDPSSLPRDFATEAEARAAGFRTVNPPRGSGLPLRNCAPAVHLNLFVQAPVGGTGTSLAFNILLGGKAYAPVGFTVDRSAYGEIEKSLDQLRRADAATRGVPLTEGLLSAYYVTLSTRPEVLDKPLHPDPAKRKVTVVHLNLNTLLGPDNRPVRVEDAVKGDLAKLAAQIATASSAPADGEDPTPF